MATIVPVMHLLTSVDWLIAPTVFLGVYIYYRLTRRSLDRLRGPESPSYIFGNLFQLLHADAGETELQWYAEYGPIVGFSGVMGEKMLLVADVKALHHMFQASGYTYVRDYMRRMLFTAFGGRGLTVVEGESHRRQRRVIQPSFGASESRALISIFFSCAEKMTAKWTELLSVGFETSTIFDIPSWVSRGTLDAIGLAAFDYDFGALDNANNELSRVYRNMFKDIFQKPPRSSLLIMGLFKYLPESLVRFLLKSLAWRSPRMARLKELTEVSWRVSDRLLKEKSALEAETVKKDVMAKIIAANASENPRSRLSSPEMYSLMSTILVAGHETTANSLSWTTLELCRHPDCQKKLRLEIQARKRTLQERGSAEFTAKDFDSMPYLTAVVKEVLRLHPALPFMQRTPVTDDVMPLSKPLMLKTGEVVEDLLIPKGTTIFASIAAYNRTPEIFGADAHSFNPDRWLKSDGVKNDIDETSIGVYANLFTFSGGTKACLGWRFAVYELHAFIISIFGKFEVHLAVDPSKIKRTAAGFMIPTLDGEEDKGAQLPVRVRVLDSMSE